jgi:hypothetical protein
MTHYQGAVTVFEPSSRMVETIERTIEGNQVADLVTVEYAAIGPVRDENAAYFGPADGDRRPADAVPPCELLELDAEGAECVTLSAIDVPPRTIVVETHPHAGCPVEEVEAALPSRGYDVVAEGTAGVDDDLPVLTATRPDE